MTTVKLQSRFQDWNKHPSDLRQHPNPQSRLNEHADVRTPYTVSKSCAFAKSRLAIPRHRSAASPAVPYHPTCAFFSRSVKTENQSGAALSSSKVMIAKASVEPLNCDSWWQAMQCCTCLIQSAVWQKGSL